MNYVEASENLRNVADKTRRIKDDGNIELLREALRAFWMSTEEGVASNGAQEIDAYGD